MAINRAKLLESADKLVRQGKLDEAIRQYQVLSEDNPRDVNTINRIGDLYVRLRKNREAIRQFMRIADFYDNDGFHLKAIAMYKKIAKLEPTHVEASERLADLYARQGLSSEARNQFLALADQCLKSGQKPKAIQLYERVRDLEPNNIKIHLLLAELHGRDGEQGKALEALLLVARNLRSRSLFDEAHRVLQKAAKIQPSHPEVLSEMAQLLQSSGKSPQEVLPTLETLYKGEPRNPRYLQLLAEAYLNANQRPQFDELVATVPGGEARATLAEVESAYLSRQGENGKAGQRLSRAAEEGLRELPPERVLSLLEKAHQLEPDRPEPLEKILALATTASNREGMISACERLAQLLVRQEAWERAKPILNQLESLAPDNATAKDLKAKLPAPEKKAEPALAAASVPTLDELEKFVDLDSLDEGGDTEAEVDRFEDEGPPVEASADGPVSLEPGEETEDLSDADEQGEAQDRAYAGKSVIQEMRGDPAQPEMDEDFLNEHFTEAEVFLKYGLVEKAREQLQTILNRYSHHLPSWEKLLEIALEEGKKAQAAEVCLKIAALHRTRGEEDKAKEREAQARELHPGATEGPAPPTPAPSRPIPAESDLELELAEDPLATSAETRISPVPAVVSADATSSTGEKKGASDSGLEEELSIELLEEPEASRESLSEEMISEKVSQIEFSLQQGLKEEAAEILTALEREVPEHPEISRLRAKTERGTAPAEPGPASVAEGDVDMDVERAFGRGPRSEVPAPTAPAPAAPAAEDGFFDLAAELQAHAVDSAPDVSWNDPPAGLSPREEANIDEIFRAFRKKVDQQVGDEDYETRYNLGIAYKEMGLLDEAIGEFQYASRDPKLFLECCSILGICFREKGMLDLAIKWYRKALGTTGYAEEKYQGLRYDLGELHLERGEFPQALALFSEVYGTNSNYRDVAIRIRELRKRVG